MSCPEVQEHLQNLLDGVPELGCRAAVDDHLRHCAECRELMDAATRLLQGLRQMPAAIPVPAGFADRVVGAIQWDRRRTVRLARRYLSVAAAVLLAGLAVWAAATFFKPPANPVDPGGRIIPLPPPIIPNSPTLREEIDRMPSVLVRLTEDVTRDARKLMPPIDTIPSPPMPQWPALADLPVDQVTKTVSSGLEPVTNSFGRAGEMFLRVIPPMEDAKTGL